MDAEIFMFAITHDQLLSSTKCLNVVSCNFELLVNEILCSS